MVRSRLATTAIAAPSHIAPSRRVTCGRIGAMTPTTGNHGDLHPDGRVHRRAVGRDRPGDLRPPGPRRRVGARHAAEPRRHHRRLRGRPAHALACRPPRSPSAPAPTTSWSSPSLCHDIGKAVSVPNHPRIAAEILRPYVRDEVQWMIQVHQDFQGRHYYAPPRRRPERARPARRSRVVRARRALRRRVGPARVRSRLRHAAARALRRPRPRGVRCRPSRSDA